MGSDTEAEKKRAPVALAPIAKPLAGKKLCKRTLKLVRRGLEDCYTPRSPLLL
jgi:H/ACA ribonucleoprotein complex subunit 2